MFNDIEKLMVLVPLLPLAATIVIHPSTAADPRVAAALDKALDELRYGTVCINHWPALGFAFGFIIGPQLSPHFVPIPTNMTSTITRTVFTP